MAVAGHVVKSVTFKIGSTDYACAVTGVKLTPSVQQVETIVLCADGRNVDLAPTQWTLDIDYNVDHGPTSFFTFLFTNAGATPSFEYIASDGLAKFTGTVRVLPGNADAAPGEFESGSVSLPVLTGPTRTAITP